MSKRKIPAFKKKILILILILIFLIIVSNIFQKEWKNFTYKISSPFQKILWQAGSKTSQFLGIFTKAKEEKEKLKKVEEENKKLRVKLARLKEVKRENENLRTALGLGIQKDFKLSLAEIIGKDISNGFILLNKGAENGIVKNMPVITSDKILLGKIEKVYKNFSKVILLSNKKTTFDVKIQGSEDISGLGKGEGGSKIIIDFIPREKKVSEEDNVISDSLGGIFPGGLLIGKVKKVEKNDLDLFQKVEVEPAFNINQTNFLFVITGKNGP